MRRCSPPPLPTHPMQSPTPPHTPNAIPHPSPHTQCNPPPLPTHPMQSPTPPHTPNAIPPLPTHPMQSPTPRQAPGKTPFGDALLGCRAKGAPAESLLWRGQKGSMTLRGGGGGYNISRLRYLL